MSNTKTIADYQREIKELKGNLTELTFKVFKAVKAYDHAMEQPPSNERARCIGGILNVLEQTNDSIMHSGLGYSLEKIKKLKRGVK